MTFQNDHQHKIHSRWSEEAKAARHIREAFGIDNAIEYVVVGKLLAFESYAQNDPDYRAEFPLFRSAVMRIFTWPEIQDYLKRRKNTKLTSQVNHALPPYGRITFVPVSDRKKRSKRKPLV